MDFLKDIKKLAKRNPKNIILPEGNEPRIIEATRRILKLGLAHIILFGNEDYIARKLGKKLIKKGRVEVITPRNYAGINRVAAGFYTLRKAKGMTPSKAKSIMTQDAVYLAAMMVRVGLADGFVAGAAHTTRNVAKAAIHCMEKERGINVISSSFVMTMRGSGSGRKRSFIFADCGIVPDPDYKQLAEIAVVSSRLARSILEIIPRVAMLSYSTKGSGRGELVDKVVKATAEARKMDPDLNIDGELQLDAAIVPGVARIKAPRSKVAGKANVLIFPNLDTGNIAYKLTQRLANATATGPLLQGFAKPASDLSRGCSIDDIVDTVAVTCVRAQ